MSYGSKEGRLNRGGYVRRNLTPFRQNWQSDVLSGGILSGSRMSYARVHLMPPPSLRQANKRYTIAAHAYVDVTLVNRSAIVNDDYNNEATDVQATDGPIDGGRQPTD